MRVLDNTIAPSVTSNLRLSRAPHQRPYSALPHVPPRVFSDRCYLHSGGCAMRTLTNLYGTLLPSLARQSCQHHTHPLDDITDPRLCPAIATSASVSVLPLTIYVSRFP